MTNKKQELEQRLNREFEICDRHILRIEEALDELTDLLPMSVEDYVGLNSEQIRCLDQFIFRFSKLQDAMGPKYSGIYWNIWMRMLALFLCVTC